MRRQGITPVMVTGDNRRAAERVASKLGIEEVRAEVLPEDKTEIVRDLQRHGRVAMVGDGIKDALRSCRPTSASPWVAARTSPSSPPT